MNRAAATRNALEAVTRSSHPTRTCTQCRGPLPLTARSDAKCCSARCRVAKMRSNGAKRYEEIARAHRRRELQQRQLVETWSLQAALCPPIPANTNTERK